MPGFPGGRGGHPGSVSGGGWSRAGGARCWVPARSCCPEFPALSHAARGWVRRSTRRPGTAPSRPVPAPGKVSGLSHRLRADGAAGSGRGDQPRAGPGPGPGPARSGPSGDPLQDRAHEGRRRHRLRAGAAGAGGAGGSAGLPRGSRLEPRPGQVHGLRPLHRPPQDRLLPPLW